MTENAKGALFKNDKQSGNQPDWTGNVELTTELLRELLKEAEQTGKYKARLAAWLKEGQRGKFLSVSLNAPFHKDGSSTGQRGPSKADSDVPW